VFLAQQTEYVVPGKSSNAPLGNRRAEKLTFVGLKGEHSLLDCISGNQPVNQHGVLLPDSVRPVGCLVLNSWIPPWVNDIDMIGSGQVQANPSGLEGEQENARSIRPLKVPHDLIAVACGSIDPSPRECPFSKLRLNEIKKRCPLREY
jgi:hypothetical protein